MTKEEILKKAKELITGDRNETHGDAFQNHAEIAEFWNIFLDKNKCIDWANKNKMFITVK